MTPLEFIDPAAVRYLTAYRQAEHIALAAIASTRGPRQRQRLDVWELLALRVPPLGEWAAFFAYVCPRVEAVAAGRHAIISDREADDLVRDVRTFAASVTGRNYKAEAS